MENPKKNKVINKWYREFLDGKLIRMLSAADIQNVLDHLRHTHHKQARALIIIAYYSGARPNEYLRLTRNDFKLDANYVQVQMPGSKRGVSRIIHLDRSHRLVKELLEYVMSVPLPDMFLFYKFRSKYKVIAPDGTILDRYVTTGKLKYWFYEWFGTLLEGGVPPYYLRHNAFSRLAINGATMEQLRQIKGSKKLDSVLPYLHMSSEMSKKIAKINY